LASVSSRIHSGMRQLPLLGIPALGGPAGPDRSTPAYRATPGPSSSPPKSASSPRDGAAGAEDENTSGAGGTGAAGTGATPPSEASPPPGVSPCPLSPRGVKAPATGVPMGSASPVMSSGP